ncbi:MAG: DUF2971 domain-containing protein [Lewinellaceae bacterium]|nr:DUF2971 domain-containing protein [Lewinellaceae bacterium]
MPLPPTIFKYEAFTTRSLLNLKAQSVYYGSPRNFNDPYDCAITASIADPMPDELQRMRDHYLNAPNVPGDVKLELSKLPIAEFKAQMVKSARQALSITRETFLDKNGVTCFSERNDDLLMWAHYGGQYKGFCLEFRTAYEPFKQLRSVKYVKQMPQIRVDSMIVEKKFDQIIDLYCTKSEAWAYEKEWRGIHQTAGTLYTYESSALKAVYFGPDIELGALEIICLILSGQNPEVEFWRSFRSPTEFRVQFEKFTYTSYAEAKRKGLK